MKKKIMAVLLACALTIGMTVSPVGMETVKAEETENGLKYRDNGDGSIAIYGYSGNDTEIVIDEKINGKPVTAIDAGAFLECSGLTSITIPEGVTSIGVSAFNGCSGLTEITIPKGITSIEDAAFMDCSSLTSITIPEGVTSIGVSAFFGCSNLTEITIPKGVTSIGDNAFAWCENLTNVTIPEGVTSIGDSAFGVCKSLTNVTIPEGVTSIGDRVFEQCNMTNMTIPSSVTSIGAYAFLWCESLTSVTIPSSVTSIGNQAFSYCASLTSVTIPSSVTSIEERTFECSKLMSVIIPSSVTNIGKRAFYGCSDLKDVYYSGNEEQWNSVKIDDENDYLTSANIHYISTGLEDEEISLTLDKSSLNFDTIGKSETITATVTPTSQAVTWVSDNPRVAIVENGVVTATGNGTATITATAGDKSASVTVTVSQRSKKVSLTLNGQTVSGTLKAKVKKSYTFQAVVAPSNVSAENKKITWSSSNTKVAAVKNGKVTVKKAGTAIITAKTADGKCVKVKLKASKNAVKVSKVKISSPTGKKTMKVKEKLALTLKITPATADNTKVAWSSSNKKVATVDKNGKVTAKKKGTVTITAKAKDGSGKKGTFKIKVTK